MFKTQFQFVITAAVLSSEPLVLYSNFAKVIRFTKTFRRKLCFLCAFKFLFICTYSPKGSRMIMVKHMVQTLGNQMCNVWQKIIRIQRAQDIRTTNIYKIKLLFFFNSSTKTSSCKSKTDCQSLFKSEFVKD